MNQPISRTFDAAILDPAMTREEAAAAIKTCVEIGAFSACVRPCDVELAQEICRGSETKVCVVLAFPHGLQLSASKADEAKRYVEMGVDEIDMVANYGWVRSGLWNEVKADIAAVSAVTRPPGVPFKVIFETSQLEAGEIRKLVEVCIEAGADFVKTSTGFNGEGAIPLVARAVVKPDMLRWREELVCDPNDLTIKWNIITNYFTEHFHCDGVTHYKDAPGGCAVEIDGRLWVDPMRIPGISESLVRRAIEKLEPFIGALISPNLRVFYKAIKKKENIK